MEREEEEEEGQLLPRRRWVFLPLRTKLIIMEVEKDTRGSFVAESLVRTLTAVVRRLHRHRRQDLHLRNGLSEATTALSTIAYLAGRTTVIL